VVLVGHAYAGAVIAATRSDKVIAEAKGESVMTAIHYRTAEVDGRNVFYREAGAATAPKLLLLHGFPTAGHMFRDLIPLVADRFHVVAPDLPGFGNSDMPDKGNTFARIAETIDRFTETVRFDRYAVYVFDYGAPTGFRLAVKHPDRITAIISQNGNAYEEGLSDGWSPIRAYWQDPSQANREAIRAFLKPETTVWQYTHGAADPTLVSPDGYTLDNFYLSRPGVADVQLDLFGDYNSNGARMIRSSSRPAPRRSSATSRTQPCASMTLGISLWRRTPRRSRRPFATFCPAEHAFRGRLQSGDISRHRHGRKPRDWPSDGHSSCA
jgi:pimeloyl-ACP methyl ester carboxylesterase